jgi:hypothetical protein
MAWADLLASRIAIAPTIDDDERARRVVNAKAAAYMAQRKERLRQATCAHVATARTHEPRHGLAGGGRV